jgi:hypothetical protein
VAAVAVGRSSICQMSESHRHCLLHCTLQAQKDTRTGRCTKGCRSGGGEEVPISQRRNQAARATICGGCSRSWA